MFQKPLRFLRRTDGSISTRAFRSGIWVGLAGVAGFGIAFVRGIILARLLSPDIFGLMAICLIVTRFLDIFTETGFGAALVQRQGQFEAARDTAFTLSIVRAIALAVGMYLIAPAVAEFYSEPVLVPAIRLAGLTFLCRGVYNLNTVALQKDLNFQRLSYLDLATMLADLVVSVALAYWLRSVWALVLAQLFTAATGSLLSYVFVRARLRLRFDRAIAQELFRYGRYITGSAVLLFITRELDSALIGRRLGMEALGFYTIAFSLANLPSTFLAKVLAKVYFPLFSHLQNDIPRLRGEYVRGVQLITLIAVPASVATVAIAPEILSALYGTKWMSAATPLRILAVFGCCRALAMLNGYLYNAIGKPEIGFWIGVGRLLAVVALLPPLTQMYGLVGASVAVTVPMVLQYALGLVLARRLILASLSEMLRPVWPAAAKGALVGALLMSAKAIVSNDIGLWLLLLVAGGVIATLSHRNVRTLLTVRESE